MNEHSLLSAAEAAARLGVSVRTIARMASDGRLEPVQRIGERGTYLFSSETVETKREEMRAEALARFEA